MFINSILNKFQELFLVFYPIIKNKDFYMLLSYIIKIWRISNKFRLKIMFINILILIFLVGI